MTRGSLLLLDEPNDAFSPGMEERLGLRANYDDYEYEPRQRQKSATTTISPSVNRQSGFLSAAWLAVGSRLLWSYTAKPKDEPRRTTSYETEKHVACRTHSLDSPSEKNDETLKSAMRRSPNRGKLRVAFVDASERWTESAEYLERKAQYCEPPTQDETTEAIEPLPEVAS